MRKTEVEILIREDIYAVLEDFEGTQGGYMHSIDDKTAEGEVREMLDERNIDYKLSVDEMYDSSGYDVWSLSVAYIENGELKLFVEQLVSH